MFYLPFQFLVMRNHLHQLSYDQKPFFFVEWCCEIYSKLSTWFQGQGHQVLRVGLPVNDASKRATIIKLISRIYHAYLTGFQIVIWISLPCTPWTTWQYIREKGSAGKQKLTLTLTGSKAWSCSGVFCKLFVR